MPSCERVLSDLLLAKQTKKKPHEMLKSIIKTARDYSDWSGLTTSPEDDSNENATLVHADSGFVLMNDYDQEQNIGNDDNDDDTDDEDDRVVVDVDTDSKRLWHRMQSIFGNQVPAYLTRQLPHEKPLFDMLQCGVQCNDVVGVLLATNWRLLFVGSDVLNSASASNSDNSENNNNNKSEKGACFSVALACIACVEQVQQNVLRVETKDMRLAEFTFPVVDDVTHMANVGAQSRRHPDALGGADIPEPPRREAAPLEGASVRSMTCAQFDQWMAALRARVFCEPLRHFAFAGLRRRRPPHRRQQAAASSLAAAASSDGESNNQFEYDARREFSRLSLDDNVWRVSEANINYALCATYPRRIVVPASLDDVALAEVAKFRSSSRLQALVWADAGSGAALVRCSQPMTGLLRGRSAADEVMVAALRVANRNAAAAPLHIVDCRPALAAFGNSLKGAGVEREEYYERCRVEYMDILNIHTMRDSLRRVCLLCRQYDERQRWLSPLEGTGWLGHVAQVLAAAKHVALLVGAQRATVLVHCSDGWDRTSQVSALAQLLLDPYFRTLAGFCSLVEKEWLAFGHKFGERTALGQPNGFWAHAESSPIFVQFVDCVHQLLARDKRSFEFNECFLLALLDELYSGASASFLFDSETKRSAATARSHGALSVWQRLNVVGGDAGADQQRCFRNPFYAAADGVLDIDVSMPKLAFWSRYYMRAESAEHQWHIVSGHQLADQLSELRRENHRLAERLAEQRHVDSAEQAAYEYRYSWRHGIVELVGTRRDPERNIVVERRVPVDDPLAPSIHMRESYMDAFKCTRIELERVPDHWLVVERDHSAAAAAAASAAASAASAAVNMLPAFLGQTDLVGPNRVDDRPNRIVDSGGDALQCVEIRNDGADDDSTNDDFHFVSSNADRIVDEWD
jgi:Myotubularin-like phosphatase domain